MPITAATVGFYLRSRGLFPKLGGDGPVTAFIFVQVRMIQRVPESRKPYASRKDLSSSMFTTSFSGISPGISTTTLTSASRGSVTIAAKPSTPI